MGARVAAAGSGAACRPFADQNVGGLVELMGTKTALVGAGACLVGGAVGRGSRRVKVLGGLV